MKLISLSTDKATTISLVSTLLLLSQYCGTVYSQQAGNFEEEQKPTITLKECTNDGGCQASKAKLTLDANWRWVHETSGYTNCYTGNKWTSSHCIKSSDPSQCASSCALEGVTAEKYKNTYGIEQLNNGVKLSFVTEHEFGTNVGSRLYLMENDDTYKMFYLKNREFSIQVDVSNLFCGMNGAMYFVEMDKHGGKGINQNQAGAKYGTGYCDAQCPHDIKFISGEANNVNWTPNPNDKSNNMGVGKYGACCAEMDIWEANSMATAYTPHPCNSDITQYRCEGTDCGDNTSGERYDGVCDKDGCDINPFRMGNTDFYGRGEQYEVNTLKPMTLVTQFITDDGTDEGDLVEIKRFYVQDDKIIHTPTSTILGPAGMTDSDSITDQFCEDKKTLFDDVNDYLEKGGTSAMGDSLDRGQVMVLSLWDDVEVNMLWLDSAYPLDKDESEPGVLRGECPGGEESTPTYLRNKYPDGYVIFKSVAIGEIGSTQQTVPTQSPTAGPCDFCGPAPGMSQAECNNKSYTQCKNMISNEGKCAWNKCEVSPPTKSPIASPVSTPTKSPTTSPSNGPIFSPVSTPTKSPTISPSKSPISSPVSTSTKSPTTSATDSPTSPLISSSSPSTSSLSNLPTNSPFVSSTYIPTSFPSNASSDDIQTQIVVILTQLVNLVFSLLDLFRF